MADRVQETQAFLARFREALAYLEACGELTFPRYLKVWRLTGTDADDASLLSMWNSRNLLALGSGDPECLRSITRDSLTKAIAQFEAALRTDARGDNSPADPHGKRGGVSRAEAEHHTRTGLAALRDMYRRGDYQQALAQASIMPAGVRNYLGEDDPLYARVLLSLTEFYDELGEYVGADRTAQSLLALLESCGRDQPLLYANALCLLASIRRKVGDQKGAEELLRRARPLWPDVIKSQDPAYAKCLQQLAELHGERGENTRANELLLEACDVTKAVFGEESAAYATALCYRAEHSRRDRQWAEAERLHEQALAIRQAVLPEDHPHRADSLHALGLTYDAMGRFADAHDHILKALRIRRAVLGEWHPEYGAALESLASVKAAQGRVGEALSLFHEALGVDDRTIEQAFALGAERQKLEYMAARMIRLHKYLSLVVDVVSDPIEIRLAFSFVLRRKGLVTEAIALQRDAILAGRRPDQKNRLAEIARLRAFIARRSYTGPQPGESELDYRRVLEQLSQRRDALEAELAGAIPDLDVSRRVKTIDWRTVAGLLPAGSALVEFLRIEPYDFAAIPAQGGVRWKTPVYLAFALDSADSVQLLDLGEAAPIDRLIAEFRAGVTGESDHDADRDMVKAERLPGRPAGDPVGQALRAALFDPLLGALSGRRLLLAPDGDISRLPFEVLPTDDGRRLIDDYCVSYLGCGRDVLRFQAQAAGKTGEPVVAADPDFDLRAGSLPPRTEAACGRQSRDLGESEVSFDRLPATRGEGERIARLLKVRPWLQAEVLETRLKQVRSPWVLHLATHGYFLADQCRDAEALAWTAGGDMGRFSGLRLENPLLRSGLALAGGNTWLQRGPLPPEAEDGLLTAEDVTGLDLLDTELVVLSACNTGLGEIHTGEGVFGLRRAFVLAGAKTLVMSLWKVPDEETRELMEDFYRRILAGEPRCEALRNAQLTLKAKHPHPFFWGAFICQGNPGSLPPRRRWYYSPDGKQVHDGPVTDAELKDLIRTGGLARSGKVSLDRKTWREASHLKGVRWPS